MVNGVLALTEGKMEIEAASVRANCIIRRKLLIESLILVLVLLIIAYFPCTCTASEVIPPVSTTVMLGKKANFSCSGKAFGANWAINGKNIALLGIDSTAEEVDDVLTSTITVIGRAQYDNASIQCALLVTLSESFPLPPAFLTVLGIGHVPSIKIVDPGKNSPLFIQWEKPVFVSIDVTDLMYMYTVSVSNVSVSGADLPPMNVTNDNVTNDTECCRGMLTPCQVYNITVTPFSSSPDYVGASNGTEDATDQVNPYLDGQCRTNSTFVSTNSVSCSFTCPVMRPPNVCDNEHPNEIKILVDSYSNNGNKPFLINSSVVDIDDSIVKNVSSLPANEKFYSNFTLMDLSGSVVSTMITNFTTYSVQSAKFEPLNNSVNATCIFAINAPASACKVVFKNASFGLSFSGVVNHSLPVSTGLIDIPKTVLLNEELQQLGSVVFDGEVYDMNMDENVTNNTAFELQHALVVRSGALNTDIHVPGSTTVYVSSIMAMPSISPTGNGFQVVIGVGIGVAVTVMVILMIVTLSVTCYSYMSKTCDKKNEEYVTYDVMQGVLLCNVVSQKSSIPESDSIPKSNNTPESNSIQADLDAYMVHESPLSSNATTTSDTTATTDVSTGSVDNGTKQCNPAYEDITIKHPQPNPPTGGSHYADLAPRPLDAPMILHDLDGVQYKQIRKHVVEYAELAYRPANAPPVLPPDVGVNYVDVKPTPEAKVSLKLDEKKAEQVQSKKHGVVYAELGSRPANAPVVLPPDSCVQYVDVRPTLKAKNFIPGTTASFGMETTISADTNLVVPPKLPPKRTGRASEKATSSNDSTNSPQQSINPPSVVKGKDVNSQPWEVDAEVESEQSGATNGVHVNDQGYTDTMDDQITSGYRCTDIAGKKSSEMVFESSRIITKNEDFESTSNPRDPGNTTLHVIAVCTVEPVPSFAWKSNVKEGGNCFGSLELNEHETQHSTQESTYESQNEENGHKLDSGSPKTDEHFEKGLCLMTSENCGPEKVSNEAGELIVASNLISEVVPMPCVQG